jgi:nicotinamidase-related amidase
MRCEIRCLLHGLASWGKGDRVEQGQYTEKQVLALARRAYEQGEASFEFLAEECALLVIDMQDEFVKPGWTPYWVPQATSLVPRIKRLVEHCRKKGIPVIYSVFSRTNNYLDRPRTGDAMPNRYSELGLDQSAFFVEGRVWHELAPREGEIVIHKPSYGAFYDTPLETVLRNLGKDTVIISGTLTNYCCGMTARQAYERGFKVVFGSDVTATDDPEMQEPELKVLRKGFAKVLSADDICALL